MSLEALLNLISSHAQQNEDDKQIVDKETLHLLFGIKNSFSFYRNDYTMDQIELRDQREEGLLRWLIQTAKFWINQSYLDSRDQDMIEHYWLLIKSFYVRDSMDLPLFDAQMFISIMCDINFKFTKYGQVSCCKSHN